MSVTVSPGVLSSIPEENFTGTVISTGMYPVRYGPYDNTMILFESWNPNPWNHEKVVD